MRRILLTLVVALFAAGASAQGINNVRINEVLVENQNNYMDDYGHRSSWIELFNTGYEVLNVASCYLGVTDASGKETLYTIPSSDPNTVMHARTYLVFFCEGTDTKGTFYTNFTLQGATKITLYSGSKIVIDEFAIDPAAQRPDVSMGYMSKDGVSPSEIMALPRTTPASTNETVSAVPKAELFLQRDPAGVVMAIIAMSVVFSALLLIFFVLKGFGIMMVRLEERKNAAPAAVATAAAPKLKSGSVGDKFEEEAAAIGLALRMYQEERHINETTVITINRASRVYSPWSSKIHGIPAMPTKK
ncbi:MAG: OadG family protein [Alistipes sp.]|nr:OadG family protein [Alistipes sp.]